MLLHLWRHVGSFLLQARPLRSHTQCTCTNSRQYCQSVDNNKQLNRVTEHGVIYLHLRTPVLVKLHLWASSCVRLSEEDTETREQVKDQQQDKALWQLYDKALCEHTCGYVMQRAVAVPVCFREGCDSPSHVAARCWDWEADAQWQLPPRSHRPAQSHCRW